jgi:hypothetical protein
MRNWIITRWHAGERTVTPYYGTEMEVWRYTLAMRTLTGGSYTYAARRSGS